MDGKQFFDLIKNIYSALKCPSCGEVYAIEEVQFLGHFDGLFLMQMTCSNCRLPVSVNFYTKSEPKGNLSDISLDDVKTLPTEPISTNEVIEFHRILKSFDGDFKKSIKKKK